MKISHDVLIVLSYLFLEISKRDQQFGEVSSDDIPWMVVTCILGVFFVLLAAGGGFFVWKRFSRKMKPKKPPAGYPPERNGFVNPTLAKKEEDKEAGIYISSNSVSLTALHL